ncbi:MAG: helix-turn-helix transcriptional regulator [Clostridia bacterium]|nr:helix-turn-helix transcriptional regulator [Clostridia bacterium]
MEGGAVLGNRAVSQGLIELGERIRKRRREVHLSQEAFAEKVGISVNTVSRVEGGQTAMSIEIFKKMVEILEVDADDLLGKCPKEKEKNKYDTLVRRIQQLKENEQKIVMQTMEVLIDGINKFHK